MQNDADERLNAHRLALNAAWFAMHRPGSEDMFVACINAYLSSMGDSGYTLTKDKANEA